MFIFEEESFETKTIGFEMDIIKSNKVLATEKCAILNKFSKNKKFVPFQNGEDWFCRCNNFFDGVDIVIENNRISLNLNFEEDRINEIYENLKTNNYGGKMQDYRVIECIRLFWTYPKSSPTLYPYANHEIWKLDAVNKKFLDGYFNGLNEFSKF